MNRPAKNNQQRYQKDRTRESIVRRAARMQSVAVICGLLLILTVVTTFPILTASSASSRDSTFRATEFASLFQPTDGTITIKTGNYIGPSTTETAKFTKQIFSSTDCTGSGGSIDTITGVDSITGYSFTLGSTSSVLIKIPNSGIYF